jgi:hypothetical protein
MQPLTYRIAQPPNAKNPINHSVVLALGESNNGRLKQIKSTPVVWQDHTEIYGVCNLLHRLMPLRRFNYKHIFKPCQTIQVLKVLIAKFLLEAQFSIGTQPPG